MAMFRLDYLSCLLTVLATILVGRKMWTGLVVSGLNSLIVCVIGFHTSQYGFIPANVFCICINAFSLRAWLKAQKDRPALDTDTSSGLLTGGKRMSASKKAAMRRLSLCRIRREERLANSISLPAIRDLSPFAQFLTGADEARNLRLPTVTRCLEPKPRMHNGRNAGGVAHPKPSAQWP